MVVKLGYYYLLRGNTFLCTIRSLRRTAIKAFLWMMEDRGETLLKCACFCVLPPLSHGCSSFFSLLCFARFKLSSSQKQRRSIYFDSGITWFIRLYLELSIDISNFLGSRRAVPSFDLTNANRKHLHSWLTHELQALMKVYGLISLSASFLQYLHFCRWKM